MNEAEELIRIVEQRGGRLTIKGEKLVIEPGAAAMALIDSLRTHKPQIVALLQSREQETGYVSESDAVGLWMLARCVYRDRCWGGVGALYLDLARWCAANGRPAPETRQSFVAELQTEGFAFSENGSVAGLMLAEDWEAHERFQVAAQASGTPERATLEKRRHAGRPRP